MNENIKRWIGKNILSNRGLTSKKCNKQWFLDTGNASIWNDIISETSFLNSFYPTFPQRVWHIFNGGFVKCSNPDCNNPPTFFSFTKGYLKTCSYNCAQKNPDTIEKIKKSNLKKYGTVYPLLNKEIRKKADNTMMMKYGVSNPSLSPELNKKRKKTCLKNYGTEWFLERQDIKERIIKEKYGVNNIQSVEEISKKRADTVKNEFYDTLIHSDRFKNKVEIAFSKEDYNGVGYSYKFKCKLCNNIFDYVLRYDRIPRCELCFPNLISIPEKELTDFIKNILPDIQIDENCRTVLLNNKELDIYLSSKNLAIEFNGLYWHGEFTGDKPEYYHLNKTKECESKNIHLLHIFEDEWTYKKEIVKSRIKHILNVNKQKIFARKCDIINLSSYNKKLFLESTHIQGNDNSSINYALLYKNEIVALMTFGKLRKSLGSKHKEDVYEMYRYSTIRDTSVVGGASKLLSHFIHQHTPKQIVSYADRRWTYYTNNLYEKLGFKKVSDGTPNYWYFKQNSNYKRHHRFAFAKHTLSKKLENFDPNLTEWENMKLNGWDRIWDCGSIKYVLTLAS